MNRNSISVVIPTYNREKTIEYCINSVLNQTVKPYEIIIVDDCSTDKTLEVINSFNNQIIKVVKLDKNSGAQAARNKGIMMSEGEWVAFQDSDDEWLPEKLEMELKKAEDGKYSVIYCECFTKKNNVISLFGTPNYEYDSYKKLLSYPGPTFPGLLVKKECFSKVGLLDENVPSYQEWETSIRLSKEYRVGYVDVPLYIYNLHEGETISKNSHRDVLGWTYIVNKYENDIKYVVGVDALCNHYHIIIDKYLLLKNNEAAHEYGKRLIELKYGNLSLYFWKYYYERTSKNIIRFFNKLIRKLREIVRWRV